MGKKKVYSFLIIAAIVVSIFTNIFLYGPIIIFCKADPGDITEVWNNQTTLNVTVLGAVAVQLPVGPTTCLTPFTNTIIVCVPGGEPAGSVKLNPTVYATGTNGEPPESPVPTCKSYEGIVESASTYCFVAASNGAVGSAAKLTAVASISPNTCNAEDDAGEPEPGAPPIPT